MRPVRVLTQAGAGSTVQQVTAAATRWLATRRYPRTRGLALLLTSPARSRPRPTERMTADGEARTQCDFQRGLGQFRESTRPATVRTRTPSGADCSTGSSLTSCSG